MTAGDNHITNMLVIILRRVRRSVRRSTYCRAARSGRHHAGAAPADRLSEKPSRRNNPAQEAAAAAAKCPWDRDRHGHVGSALGARSSVKFRITIGTRLLLAFGVAIAAFCGTIVLGITQLSNFKTTVHSITAGNCRGGTDGDFLDAAVAAGVPSHHAHAHPGRSGKDQGRGRSRRGRGQDHQEVHGIPDSRAPILPRSRPP